MTTPNAPTGVAAEHLKLEPKYAKGVFNQPWPGLRPTVAQRRTYMRAFMNWYKPTLKSDEVERELRQDAEIFTAEKFILAGKEPASSMMFESLVDCVIWMGWCKYLLEPLSQMLS